MSIELELLVWSAVLALVQMLVAVAGAQMQIGLPRLAGNREGLPPLSGWALRAQRAHLNLLESLVLFAIAVLVAEAAGWTSATTAVGAQLFFWGRLAYAIVYVAGIPWLRTAIWGVATTGIVLILFELLGR
jgi:uncharacterized MAPEG superfamily protein